MQKNRLFYYVKEGAKKAKQCYEEHPEERKMIWNATKRTIVTGSKSAAGFTLGAAEKGFSNIYLLTKLGLSKNPESYSQILIKQKEKYKSLYAAATGFSVYESYDFLLQHPNVELAYELANPIKASQVSLQEAIDSMDSDAKAGFISELKGKLFEIQYVDYLNDGNLPSGFSAKLADTANQPGYDIEILNNDGIIDQTLQLKATNDISYIQEALDRYPDIPIVSTEEVFAEAGMRSLIDSGISNEELTQTVSTLVDPSVADIDILPGELTILLLGATVCFTNPDLSIFEKARKTGEKYADAVPGHIIGGAVGMAIGGPIGLLAAISAGYVTRKYGNILLRKAYAVQKLKHQIKINNKILARMSG